jgi:predicted kinase
MQTMMTKQNLIDRVKQGRHVVVLRGISGSGKSTLAQELVQKTPASIAWVSADQYFTDEDGGYHFDPAKLGEAHGDCLRQFVRNLQVDATYGVKNSLVIVDNTNTTVAEAAPYMALAAAYGFNALLVTLDADPRKAALRNVHGVSPETTDAQYVRLTAETPRLPPFWETATLVEEKPGIEYVREVPVVLGETLDPSELANRGQR